MVIELPAKLLRLNAECAVGRISIASGHPSDGEISRPMGVSKPSIKKAVDLCPKMNHQVDKTRSIVITT